MAKSCGFRFGGDGGSKFIDKEGEKRKKLYSLFESGIKFLQVIELVVRNYYGEFDPGSG